MYTKLDVKSFFSYYFI